MRLRTRTIDLLAAEFAEAVASGDNAGAEGWLATAIWASQRQRTSGRFRLWARSFPSLGRIGRRMSATTQ
jgi:hypothetical protein